MKPIVFDASFAIQRLGQMPTGIGRVERAWLKYIIGLNSPVYFSVRRNDMVMLLGKESSSYLLEILEKVSSDNLNFKSKMLWKLGRKRRAVRTNLAQFAIMTWHSFGKKQMISEHFKRLCPQGGWYISAGLHPGEDVFLDTIREAGFRTAVMLHDTIALDFPQYCEASMQPHLQGLVKYQAKSGDYLICNSQSTADSFVEHALRLNGNPVKTKYIVSHLGLHDTKKVNDSKASASYASIDKKRPIFMILGTIEPRKNHSFIVDLWEKIAQETKPENMPQLVVLGHWGWKIEGLKNRLESSPLLGWALHLLIGPDDATVAQLLADCNALLMPSFAEGYGLPVLEAARDGIPVIANDLAVYREIAGDYPDLCSIDDPAGWERLIKLHSQKRERLQPPAIPTWDQHFERVMNALRATDTTEG
ncbi:glycosyltransferase family 1 protein [Brucella sp. H1_1004]|uniref:glycosyltransferase family 4 protein n=1 Tax=Brucella sp. H1_1004 TaxID=3110109 RepID=UPI0039B66BF9